MESIIKFDMERVIVDSVTDVYDMMLSMAVSPLESYSEQSSGKSRILGSISMVGEVIGIVNIEVSKDFSKKMVVSMLDLESEEIAEIEDIQDVLGEVCNMVAGSLKSALCDAGMECELSTPALIMGKDYYHEAKNMTRQEKFEFSCGEDRIVVFVGLKPADGSASINHQPAINAENRKESSIYDYNLKDSVFKSVSDVFDMMLSMNVVPFSSNNGKGVTINRIVGSISFSGKVMGRVNLHVPESFSRSMASSMFGIEIEEMEGLDEAKDVVGELCNMISGALKSDFCDVGLDCRVSPPSFTTGSDFEVECLNLARHERFSFCHNNDIFTVEVGLKPGDR